KNPAKKAIFDTKAREAFTKAYKLTNNPLMAFNVGLLFYNDYITADNAQRANIKTLQEINASKPVEKDPKKKAAVEAKYKEQTEPLKKANADLDVKMMDLTNSSIEWLENQYNIRLIVTAVATKNTEDIYITGNFNSWNPGDVNYRLKPFAAGRKAVVIKDIPAGTYAFKFTRGSFDKVETEGDGRDIADRVIEATDKDVTEDITIKGWKDNYPDKPKPYTASPQVKIIDTAFAIPQLDRKRRIWLYLPKGYATSTKTYPVLYMHDGQNLFNEQTAPFGEWGVDEILDSIQKANGKECIVVGIDNGGDK
ncbi:unnamed protein product, partial [Rotaria sp. Silwood1]